MEALEAMPGSEQIAHIFRHPDHPLSHPRLAGDSLVDFMAAVEWHERIHRTAIAESFDLGHTHDAPTR